jgi:hypothetical protein
MPNDARLNRRREDPMAGKGWLREFDDPIALPDGKSSPRGTTLPPTRNY